VSRGNDQVVMSSKYESREDPGACSTPLSLTVVKHYVFCCVNFFCAVTLSAGHLKDIWILASLVGPTRVVLKNGYRNNCVCNFVQKVYSMSVCK